MDGVFMKKSEYHLKKWEIALLVSLCVTLGWGLLFGETECCAWWGTVYPELSAADACVSAAAVSGGGETVVLRFRVLEWLAALLAAMK